jgi:hypothetical protein
MREDRIVAKGKGELVSYWLETTSMSTGGRSNRSSENSMGSNYEDAEKEHEYKITGTENLNRSKSVSAKTERLIDWNTDVLCRLLKQIMIRRGVTTSTEPGIESKDIGLIEGLMDIAKMNPFEEVKEIISLPPLSNIKALHGLLDVEVPKNGIEQLHDYVSQIAAMYNNNPFHNFEHVCRWIGLLKIFHFFAALTQFPVYFFHRNMCHYLGISCCDECYETSFSHCCAIGSFGWLQRCYQ